MAGDRRATAGNLISHRAMEKVVEADRHSGVAIAGAAGPAMDMVRLFQLQLEHYEKVEGVAAQPGGQGQPAVDDDPRQPAGGDDGPRRRADLRRLRRAPRRSAGCGPTTSPAAATRSASTWPPARAACTPAPSSSSATATRSTGRRPSTSPAGRCGRPPTPTRPPAVPTRCAASTRSSPRSPPTASRASTTTSWRSATRRSPSDGRATTGGRPHAEVVMTMPFYVAPEQVMKDRADYARKGIARGRALVAVRYADGIAIVAENTLGDAAQGQRDLRPHRLRRRRQVQRVRPAARRRRPRRRPQGLPVQPRRRRRPQPRQPVRPDPRPDLHPRDEADGGRDPRRRGRR